MFIDKFEVGLQAPRTTTSHVVAPWYGRQVDYIWKNCCVVCLEYDFMSFIIFI